MSTLNAHNTEDSDAIFADLSPRGGVSNCAAVTARQGATSGSGSALRVSNANASGAAIDGWSAGDLINLKDASGVTRFRVTNTGAQGLSASNITPTTVANSTTETVVSSVTLPANRVAVGTTWQASASGVLSTANTGSPQITANLRVGGLSGASLASIVISATTGQTNVSFIILYTAACVTTGPSGTWVGTVYDIDVLSGPAANVSVSPSPVTRDTTISNDLVLTLQWGAAVSGNSFTVVQAFTVQVA